MTRFVANVFAIKISERNFGYCSYPNCPAISRIDQTTHYARHIALCI